MGSSVDEPQNRYGEKPDTKVSVSDSTDVTCRGQGEER